MASIVQRADVGGNGKRKEEHLRIALNHDISFRGLTTGFEEYQFIHQALPEIDKCCIDLSVRLLGKPMGAPLVISAMVGGIEEAGRINRNLAIAAQHFGLAMGLGSQRCAIEDATKAASYRVRDVAPDILLFANLGAVQLNCGYGLEQCRKAVEMAGADALVLHLNPLQEAMQPEGNTNFAGLLARIEHVCRKLPVPVIVKEVGWGISESVGRQLVQAGVSCIDTAGSGGTSWSEVERLRSNLPLTDGLAAAFSSWGIPTTESIVMVRKAAASLPVIASGGIRNGLDVAKALALGADAAGVAVPLLKAADISSESVILSIGTILEELRLAMFCIGAGGIDQIKGSPLLRKRGGG